ncbi:MAG: catalase HPII [Halobacteriovoraceae bacterium]|nr:catalase HPII [Halobacteriovoraceae bacterium]|tara:strand:+ start:23908 stop:25977 length:2070 start_codon:yes stop_codon:yes gene_type:complete
MKKKDLINQSYTESGENHQQAQKDNTLTTQQGVKVSDNQNTLKVGNRGPTLVEDFQFREKLFHFDHERIPERVVHARGYGIHGHFESYGDHSDLTIADPLTKKGKKTPVFVRFSTVAGNKGSVDLARDVRGFAVKFYTEEGNWDLVGNNIPVFFIQDAKKFPDLVHAAKAEPDRGFPQAQTAHDNFWDFISLSPESMHMVMWIMSDRTIPRSFRFMEGFGVHTFRMINAKGKSQYVKFHWKPLLGMQSVMWNEAVKINGADPDFHRRDMWQAIEDGQAPEWELGVQVFDEEFEENYEYDILDATKLIPEEVVPIKPLGKMVLNKNVDNFFAETEQVAFCTQNVIPGIDFTNDPLLQGRNFSYLDTQLKRLGSPNFTHIPINAPRCPVHNLQQDGHMAMRNPKGRVNYEPNSWEQDKNNPRESKEEGFHPYPALEMGYKTFERGERFADHYSQAELFYTSQTEIEQEHIQSALIFELSKVETLAIRERMVSHLLNIDKDLAKKVAKGLGIKNLPEPMKMAREKVKDVGNSDALSILKNVKSTLRGRKIGIIVTKNAENELLSSIQKELNNEKCQYDLILQKISEVKMDDGKTHSGDEFIDGAPSVLYDAVIVLGTKDQVKELSKEIAFRDFVNDAFFHKKFIGFNKEIESLILDLLPINETDGGMISLTHKNISKYIKKAKELRYWERKG